MPIPLLERPTRHHRNCCMVLPQLEQQLHRIRHHKEQVQLLRHIRRHKARQRRQVRVLLRRNHRKEQALERVHNMLVALEHKTICPS